MNNCELISIPSSRNLSECESGNDQQLFPVSPWNQRSENHLSSRINGNEGLRSNGQKSKNLSSRLKSINRNDAKKWHNRDICGDANILGDHPQKAEDVYFIEKDERQLIFKITRYGKRALKDKIITKNRKVISKCPHTSMKYYAKGMCK